MLSLRGIRLLNKALPLIAAVSVGSWATAQFEAGLRGQVMSASGQAVSGAQVLVLESGATSLTDEAGEFRLANVEFPLHLQVTHPRFRRSMTKVDQSLSGPVNITLLPRAGRYEEIDVRAEAPPESSDPLQVFASEVDPQMLIAPSTVVQAAIELPSVSENGQAGLFQTYSVRGISRQRVQTRLSGMRIVSERRAGVSASFFDPTLVGGLEVLRGPASTQHGSGAVGGAIELQPRTFDSLQAQVGYAEQGMKRTN